MCSVLSTLGRMWGWWLTYDFVNANWIYLLFLRLLLLLLLELGWIKSRFWWWWWWCVWVMCRLPVIQSTETLRKRRRKRGRTRWWWWRWENMHFYYVCFPSSLLSLSLFLVSIDSVNILSHSLTHSLSLPLSQSSATNIINSVENTTRALQDGKDSLSC